MSVLVDTSVVIDYARGRDARLMQLLPSVSPAVCGIVRAELLCGARDARHRASLLALLSPFQVVPIHDAVWDAVGENLAALRGAGITVPFPDAVIATVAIENDLELWAHDQQYALMQTVVAGLRLFQEPP